MFTIPSNLGDLTAEAIRRHRAEAVAEYNTELSVAREAPDQVTNDWLDRMEALRTFVADADTALGTTDGSGSEPATGADAATRLDALAPMSGEDPINPGADDITAPPTIADVAGRPLVTAQAAAVVDATLARSAITASAGLHGYTSGQVLDNLNTLSGALGPRLESYVGLSGGVSKDPVATITLPLTEFAVNGDHRDLEVLDRLLDETRLPGGSLVAARAAGFASSGNLEGLTAAAGWCAPSEIDYSVQFHGAASGLYDVPTVTANRGGLWIMPEINFTTIYGSVPAPGSNFFQLTELQVIAGTVKTFVEVDCPTPVEYRLGVTGFGLVAGLLQLRAYPEYVREFTRASLIGLQHLRSAVNVAAAVAGSTAVDLTAALPWSGDGSVLSTILPAAEMAAVDQRYRARLVQTATIEQVFPLFTLAQLRADFMRRNGTGGDPSLADAWIMNWFSQRYIAPQFIYGWQDAYTAGGTTPGAATPITAFPLTTKFLSYPAGTWVNAVADVIQLSTVYDSVRLASNQAIEFFTEQGNRMVPKRADSRVYTVPTCPNGSTGVQRAVTCTSG